MACRATLPGRTFRTVQGHRLAHGASPVAALTIERCDIPNGTDMTPHIPENFSTWLVEWSPVGITGNALPPRDPNDDEDDDEDEEDEEDAHGPAQALKCSRNTDVQNSNHRCA